MFRRISYIIALQFTAFVFMLLVINGALFIAADFRDTRRQTQMRLQTALEFVLRQTSFLPDATPRSLPPQLRDRIRLIDGDREVIYTGSFFDQIPFEAREGMTRSKVDEDEYQILTVPVVRDNQRIGYIQIADIERLQWGDLPRRIVMYLLVSAGISALIFGVGILFARRSLQPAEEMLKRLEQFTQDASHELRTPLAALSSSLDLAMKTGNFREGIVSAKDDVKQIASLSERLLDLARLDRLALKREETNFSGVLQQTAERYSALAEEKGLTLKTHIEQNVVLTADATLLQQMVGNLLTNAIKFTPRGGEVRIRLTRRQIAIEDTGIGIAADDLPHIFDRFYRAERSRTSEGFGLGLALVKRIADMHDWSVQAHSTVAKGTTFTVLLHS